MTSATPAPAAAGAKRTTGAAARTEARAVKPEPKSQARARLAQAPLVEEESSQVMPRYLAEESTAIPAFSKEASAPTETPMRPISSQRSHWRLFFFFFFFFNFEFFL